MKKIKLFTFDIFDTLFVRSCGSPDLIFALLAMRSLKNPSRTIIHEFIKERKFAEIKALEKASVEDISLSRIYEEFDIGMFSSLPPKVVMSYELAIEKQHLVPVAEKIKLIKNLRSIDNSKIGFISDMYLPYDFIKELLVENGFFEIGDILLLSNVEGKTKKSGSIYKQLFDTIGVCSNNVKWEHWGDNNHSDCTNVIKNKGKCHYVRYKYTYYEKKQIEKEIDLFLTPIAHFVNIQKAVRLFYKESDINISYITNLISPLLISYTYYVLRNAINDGIECLYFFSRDGLRLYEIANQIKEHLKLNIELKYLYISRLPIYLSYLYNTDISLLYKLIPLYGKSVFNILEQFGIEDIKTLSSEYFDKNLSCEKKQYLINDLFSNEQFYKIVIDRSKKMREAFINYLRQEKFINNSLRNGFVDLSGTRISQMMINSIINDCGGFCVKGYYLSNAKTNLTVSKTGEFDCMIFPDVNPVFQKQMELIESFYTLNIQGKTIGYTFCDNIWKPIFECEKNNHLKEKEYLMRNINSKILSLYLQDICLFNNDDILHLSICMNNDFFSFPNPNYLKAFKDFVVFDTNTLAKPILKVVTIKDFLYYKKHGYLENTLWPKGSIVYTNSFFYYIIKYFNVQVLKNIYYHLPFEIKKTILLFKDKSSNLLLHRR